MADVEPTEQQRTLLGKASDMGDNPRINAVAVAGSGKTSTLQWMAERDRVPTIYLVADSSSRREAQQRFPPHVAVHTAHSLAFQAVMANRPDYLDKFNRAGKGRAIPMREIASRVDLGRIGATGGVSKPAAAAAVMGLINGFQNSRDLHLDPQHLSHEMLPKPLQKPELAERAEAFRREAWQGACRLWDAMVNDPQCPITHGTYLKWLQMDKPLFGWSRWMCDEFQDANPVMADIVEQQKDAQIIRVGDPSQQIYAWRGAINALDTVVDAQSSDHALTQSFRFGSRIAEKANTVLAFRKEPYRVEGVGPQSGSMEVDPREPMTVIARNNMTLFHYAIKAMEEGKTVAMQGGITKVASLIRSAHALSCGNHGGVKAPELKEFSSWKEMTEVAQVGRDPTLHQLRSLMEQEPAKALQNVEKLEQASANTAQHNVDRLLTTVHQAKGSEWDQVWLSSDLKIPDKIMEKCLHGETLASEEQERFNALYVALTRSKGKLHITHELKENLSEMRRINEGGKPERDYALGASREAQQGAGVADTPEQIEKEFNELIHKTLDDMREDLAMDDETPNPAMGMG